MTSKEASEGDESSVVFVPGLRLPGTNGADIRVFRPLMRALSRDAGPRPYLFCYGHRRRSGHVVLPWSGSGTGTYRFADTVGPVEILSELFAEAMARHLRCHPTGETAVVGYSVGGIIALNGIARLRAPDRERISRLVTLGAPLHGFDREALTSVFGPPFLSRGVEVLDRLVNRLYPGFGRTDLVDVPNLAPTLCVCVEGDPVAPPQSALLGWPDAPPMQVDWLRIQPKTPTPAHFTSLTSLGKAVQAVSTRHGEVIARRDVIRTIAKFVKSEIEGRR